MEARISFFAVMAQVGVTAFALMFATAQYPGREWTRTRLGKVAILSSLCELFALSLVSIGVAARVEFVWQVLAIASALTGLGITLLHHRAFSVEAGATRLPADDLQHKLNILPIFSYGALGIAGTWSLVTATEDGPLVAATIVVIWLPISGSFETYLTLAPHGLAPETPTGGMPGVPPDVDSPTPGVAP